MHYQFFFQFKINKKKILYFKRGDVNFYLWNPHVS